jgi:hypothetical protein
MQRWHLICPLATMIALTRPVETSQKSQSTLPPRLDTYVTSTVKLSAQERMKLADGGAVTKLLDADPNTEAAVFGAVWINASMHRYVEALNDIEKFERGGGFKITKRISDPPGMADFARLHLPAEDVKDLRSCRVGDCEVKLGEEALKQFQSQINWTAPSARADAEALMRELALRYVHGYLEGGNERLAVYRDGDRPTFAAREFRSMVDRMPELTA